MGEFNLEVGAPRLGWLVDGDDSTSLVPAVLEDTGSQILLRVAWTPDATTDYLQRWFHGTFIDWGDDSDRSKHRYAVPGVLWFHDVDGAATLVNSRSIQSRTNMHFGEGVAAVDYLVLGTGGIDYRSVNGLRSEIAGLLDWFGQRSVSHTPAFDADIKLRSVAIELASPAPTTLSRTMNLSVRPSFSTTREPSGDWRIHETAFLQTTVARLRPLRDHAALHGSVRDLLGVASWNPCGVDAQWVQRSNDPLRPISGKAISERWAPLRTYQILAGEPRTSRTRFMFQFEHIGLTGFRRWQRLRTTFSRGINPLMATLNDRHAGLEASLALSSIGLDGIGYQLALESGRSKAQADKETNRQRLQRVAEATPVLPAFDVEEWSRRASEANNGIKHANRDMPDVLTMANTLRENCLLFRLWVAGRIGVSGAAIQRAMRIDPMNSPYEIEEV